MDSSPGTPAIDIRGLRKLFGGYMALKGIDLSISKGECVSVFGPNGAGKSTLIRVLATLSRPSKGQVRVGGLDITADATRIRRLIGVVSHQTFLYDNLTAYENLKFYARMYGIAEAEDRIQDVIRQVQLTDRLRDRVGVLSRGMQQRLSIARAILHDPPIMLLDEPETGLDQNAIAILTALLRTLTAGDRTVLLTTHNLALGMALGDRVVILHKGKLAHEGSTRNLEITDLREIYGRCTGMAN